MGFFDKLETECNFCNVKFYLTPHLTKHELTFRFKSRLEHVRGLHW